MNIDYPLVMNTLGQLIVVMPLALFLIAGFITLFGIRISESRLAALVQTTMMTGLCLSLAMLALMLATEQRHVRIDFGKWVSLPHYHFALNFVFDRLSVPLVILSYLLCGLIGAFASRYMHREPGFNRFYMLFILFAAGMVLTSSSDTIETLFSGWEMVGLSSALLVAFFHERPAPVRNGLRIWIIYRFSDAALLTAAIVMHHLRGEGDFDLMLGEAPWPEGQASLTSGQALIVGLLLICAAAGKSALIPFCSWLPRAMEGPTPSSAIFYGALSVHLGAFLMLRMSPLLDLQPILGVVLVFLGVMTAIIATLVGRVQTDIKSALSFASLAQVGIIVAEIGLGFRYVALVHLLGHASLRTLQFVRAPSLLADYKLLENAIGNRLPVLDSPVRIVKDHRLKNWFYRFSLERGYLDSILDVVFVRPFYSVFTMTNRFERKWIAFLNGERLSEQPRVIEPAHSIDELS